MKYQIHSTWRQVRLRFKLNCAAGSRMVGLPVLYLWKLTDKGNLNISNLELQELPEEVYSMYDIAPSSVVVDFSSRSSGWYESVDLQRFNASGNEITEISDRIVEEFGALKHFDVSHP